MRYRRIDARIWGDKKFCSLSKPQPCGQSLFIFLLTNPFTTSIPGLYRAGRAALAEELGWPIEEFNLVFQELLNLKMVTADFEARVVFIPNCIKYNPPASANVVKGWKASWDEIPECELKQHVANEFKAFMKGMNEGFQIAFDAIETKAYTKPLPNQDQEQEHEQEQENIPAPDNLQSKSNDSAALEVFAHYQRVMQHPSAQFDSQRQKTIKEALKLFNVEQLKLAIDGCAKSDFHMGKNDGNQKYDRISTIFRDADQIENFIRKASAAEVGNNSLVSKIDHMAEGAI